MHNKIIQQFLQLYPEQCARELEDFSLDDILFFINKLSIEEVARLMPYLTPSIGTLCLENLPLAISEKIVTQLPLPTLKTIFPRLPKNLCTKLEHALPKSQQVALSHALRFSNQTAGAFMNTQVLFLSTEHTVTQAVGFVKKFQAEINSWIFCIDHTGSLQGMVTLQELISTPHSELIGHILHDCPFVISAYSPLTQLLTHESWEKQSVLPVVDEQGVLLGVLEYNKIVPQIKDLIFEHRNENLVDSLTHIMFMFSHAAEDMITEISKLTSHPPGDR